MKRRIESQQDLKHLPPVPYLHGANTTYKPYSDNKGIHCAGDCFGYVVDWQITEKKDKTTKSASPPLNH